MQVEPLIKYFTELGEYVAKLSPLIVGSSFVASLCFDYGFLYRLNMSFIDVPTSVQDHLRSSLNWLPHILVIFILPNIVGYLVGRKSNNTVKQPISKHGISWSFENIIIIGLCLLSIEASILYIRINNITHLVFSIEALCIALISKYFSARSYLISLIIIICALFTKGYNDADNLITKPATDIVYLKDSTYQNGTVMRYYDNYIMFYGPITQTKAVTGVV